MSLPLMEVDLTSVITAAKEVTSSMSANIATLIPVGIGVGALPFAARWLWGAFRSLVH